MEPYWSCPRAPLGRLWHPGKTPYIIAIRNIPSAFLRDMEESFMLALLLYLRLWGVWWRTTGCSSDRWIQSSGFYLKLWNLLSAQGVRIDQSESQTWTAVVARMKKPFATMMLQQSPRWFTWYSLQTYTPKDPTASALNPGLFGIEDFGIVVRDSSPSPQLTRENICPRGQVRRKCCHYSRSSAVTPCLEPSLKAVLSLVVAEGSWQKRICAKDKILLLSSTSTLESPVESETQGMNT